MWRGVRAAGASLGLEWLAADCGGLRFAPLPALAAPIAGYTTISPEEVRPMLTRPSPLFLLPFLLLCSSSCRL